MSGRPRAGVEPELTVEYPELVVALAGPIGVDLDGIIAVLSEELTRVGYRSIALKITDVMLTYRIQAPAQTDDSFYGRAMHKIRYADVICRSYADASSLARIAIDEIRNRREATSGSPDQALTRCAFLVRQLKRPEEVDLLRKVYGKQFLLISAYGTPSQRRDLLIQKQRSSVPRKTSAVEVSSKVDHLMDVDQREAHDAFGQNLRDTFHRADVVVDGISNKGMKLQLHRFVQAFFGRNDITPSKWEYGMYAAKSASLRSADLSRQVGAAAFDANGDLIAQGCNEVPKAFGGTYWDQEEPDWRDIRIGMDPNDDMRAHLLRDLLERLSAAGLLSSKAKRIGSSRRIVEVVTSRGTGGKDDGALIGADVMDLTEFGRVVHAEMCVICDAARVGRTMEGATLFCTAFPCHNCAKHILAAGIRRVVFMEPYPKSRAARLHSHEIEIGGSSPERVEFVPFLGISPFRYRDIFQKERRKDANGKALQWLGGEPRPMVEIVSPEHGDAELLALAPLMGEITRKARRRRGSAAPRTVRARRR